MVVCCVDYFLELPHAWRYCYAIQFDLFSAEIVHFEVWFYVVDFMVLELEIDFMLMFDFGDILSI